MNQFFKFVYSFTVVALTAFASAYFVNNGVELFYAQMMMPPMTPPNEVFSFIWSILYVLLILSYYFILISPDNIKAQNASLLFLGQLFLQILWSYLFFGTGYLLYALIVMFLLLWTVWQMIRTFASIDTKSAYLLYPYCAWLLMATYLNIGAVYLNGSQFIL